MSSGIKCTFWLFFFFWASITIDFVGVPLLLIKAFVILMYFHFALSFQGLGPIG